MHRRARPDGLAEGLGVQLARSGGVRRLEMEARHRRRAALADGWATTGDRGGHRRKRAEPHARPWTPGIRPPRITRNTGRTQSVHTADPCNTAARGITRSPAEPARYS